MVFSLLNYNVCHEFIFAVCLFLNFVVIWHRYLMLFLIHLRNGWGQMSVLLYMYWISKQVRMFSSVS